MDDREDVRALAGALYPLGVLLAVLPLVDMTMRALPFRPDEPGWRFAALGTLFGNIGTILIGLGVLATVAAYRRNVVFLRALAVLTIVAGILEVALLALFALDVVQVRRTAPEGVRHAITTSSVSATTAAVLGAIALVSLGAGAWIASRTPGRRAGKRTERSPSPTPIVVQPAMGGGRSK